MKNQSSMFLVAALFLGSMQAASADTVITTGSKGRTYHKIGTNLATALGQQGFKSSTLPSKGSVENIRRVSSGDASIGITQKDALKYEIDAGRAGDIEVLGSLYEECVYVASRKGAGIDDDGDIQKDGIKIAVGRKGSGSAVTWDYMKTLEGGFKLAATHYTGGSRALGKVAAGTLDAFLWVASSKNLNDKLLVKVLKNPKLQLVSVEDWDLNDQLPSGEDVYSHEIRDVAKGWVNDTEYNTICTSAVVIANKNADEDLLEAVADIILSNLGFLTGGTGN